MSLGLDLPKLFYTPDEVINFKEDFIELIFSNSSIHNMCITNKENLKMIKIQYRKALLKQCKYEYFYVMANMLDLFKDTYFSQIEKG